MNKEFLDEIKAKFPERIKKLGESLSDPVLTPYTNFFCFLADRDPTSDEPLVYHDYEGLILFWINETTKEIFYSADNLDPTLGWIKQVTSQNISAILTSLNIMAPSTSAWAAISSPGFNNPRRPNETRPTELIVNVQYAALLIALNVEVHISVSPDNSANSYLSISEDKDTISISTTRIKTFSGITIPPGHYYKIELVSGGAQVTISSVRELTI